MEYIYITLKTNELGKIDLKIPTQITVNELLSMVSEALDLPLKVNSQVQAEPLGRILANTATIEDEGIANGALLTIL